MTEGELRDGDLGPRFLYKALDAVATAPLRAQRRPTHRLRELLDPRSSNYDRVAAVVHVCDGLAPGVAGRWSRRLLQYDSLPLAGTAYTPYAFGTGATVFRVENRGQNLILKVYRRTLGQNLPQLVRLANYYRQKHATVSGWYGDGPLHVVPSSYFVLNAPLLATPAVGMVQPFIDRPMQDLFLDFSDGELLALLEEDASLRAQLHYFCSKTLAIAEHEGRCLDFVGRDNVSLLTQPSGDHHLIILDYGIFDLCEKKANAPAAYAQVRQRLSRLETLLRAMAQRTLAEVAGDHTVEQG